MSLPLAIIVCLYLFSVCNGTVYYTYLWQLKEYRLDRMIDTFRTGTGRRKIFPEFQVIKLVLLLIAIGHYFAVKESEIFEYYIVLALGLEFLEFCMRVIKRRVFRPKRTTKALLIMGATLCMMCGLGGAVLLYANQAQLYLGFFLLSVVVGDINSIAVGVFHPVSQRLKAKIILQAKRKLAAHGHKKVIGITGSYGKSSTKEFLYQILSEKYEVFKTPGNTNVDIGVAQVILKELQDEHEILIIEMGAYKKGEIKAICDIVNPDIGIITAVADQHLALFGSLKNIQDAKYELIESLSGEGIGFFNADSAGARDLVARAKNDGKNTFTYAVDGTAKFMALHTKVQERVITFDIHGVEFTAPVYGKQNLPNILAAIAVAKECGMTLQEIAKAVKKIHAPEKIMNLKESRKYGDNLLIIDDSYNANPDGVIAALEYLQVFRGYTKIFVFPGMLELGPKTDAEHIRVAEKIKEICDFTIFTSEDFIKPLKVGLGKEYDRYTVSDSQEETLAAIRQKIETHEKVIVLFEQRGSDKVMKTLLS